MTTLRCVIEHITFQNAENGYSVMKVKAQGYADLVTLVGCLPEMPLGSVLRCEGEWKTDKRFGSQFACHAWEEVMPATAYGIERYLGGGLVKGIGRSYAKLIVERFGTDTFDIIETDADRLLEVPGLGRKRVQQIKESWEKQKDIKNVMLFLQGLGVSTTYATKIYKEYGKTSEEKIRENPYRLADDITGIGFKTADNIAGRIGYARNDPRRCRSGIIFTLNRLSNDGHVFALREQLVTAARTLLEVEEETVRNVLGTMVATKELIADDEAVYLPALYYSESGTARLIAMLADDEESAPLRMPDMDALQRNTGLACDATQASAVCQALQSKVMVLTGGPGTGKTTTTRAIIAAMKLAGLHVLLAAPTGRATKRLGEATGMEAKTIHRLLEYRPEGFGRNELNPLEGDAQIVDECSMIDLVLMYHLLKALPPSMRLILVGDADQLPSVGAGNVLRDIIDSESIPVVRLSKIFRQTGQSRIVTNAHAIRRGELPDISNGRASDFFFLRTDDAGRAADEIVNLVKNRLPKAYGEAADAIQVLSPMQRGTAGTTHLNTLLQQALNPTGKSLWRGGTLFRTGDRVMQTRNDYDKDVYNGDMGHIADIDEEGRTMTVTFDGRSVTYEADELDELSLAYAVTIHKSQGSEYPIVVIPVLMSHYTMWQRSLIYTGVTRAKRVCVLIGSPDALEHAVRNESTLRRNTKLKERLSNTIFHRETASASATDCKKATRPPQDTPPPLTFDEP